MPASPLEGVDVVPAVNSSTTAVVPASSSTAVSASTDDAQQWPVPPRSARGSVRGGDTSSDARGEDSAAEGDGSRGTAAAFDVICCSCRSTENEGLMIQVRGSRGGG